MNTFHNIHFFILLFFLGTHNYSTGVKSFEMTSLVNDYILEKEAYGIKVYHKLNPKKDHVEYKATTTIENAKLDNFMQFFTNHQEHPKWIYKCIESKITKKENRTYLYQVLNSAWPAKNRDLSVEVVTKKIGLNQMKVDFISKPRIHSENPKYVRLTEFISKWEIEQVNSTLHLTVTTSFNPKLSMGRFLLKSYTTKIPFETLKNMKKVYQSKK